MKRFVRTIKTMPNCDLQAAKNEAAEIASQYPDFIEVSGLGGTYRDYPETWGCDKLVIMAWYARGYWADATKEIFRLYYKPKK